MVRAFVSIVLTIAAASLMPAAANAEDRAATCGAWKHVPVPGDDQYPTGGLGAVTDVEVIAPDDAWAISDHGYEFFNEGRVYRWNGDAWRRVAFPAPQDTSYWVLSALAVVSSSSVWAVGMKLMDGEAVRPLAARWNGTRWHLVPIGLWKVFGSLDGVVAIPGTERVLAVGTRYPGRGAYGSSETLALRWNGSSWRRLPSPSPGKTSGFADVATAGSAIWSVGSFHRPGEVTRMLASRWTPSGWTVRAGPRGRALAVDGTSPGAVFAVGQGREPGTGAARGTVIGFDGTDWRTVRRFDRIDMLEDVVVAGEGEVWAAGSAFVKEWNTSRPFIVRRTATGWRIDWNRRVAGRMTAVGGTAHDLWAFRTYPPVENAELWRFTSYHRC